MEESMAAQKQILTLAEGIGMGVGLSYFLDPQSGGARRAKVLGKVIHGRKETKRFAKGVRADLGERTKGLIPKFRQATRLGSHEDVDDRVLVERVRAKIGKHVAHPGSLTVEAAAGKVALSGPILAEEVEEALKVVRHVPGVKEVENRLEVHADAGGVPGLQGTSRPSHEKPGILREKWSPSLRLTTGSFGVWLMTTGKQPFGMPRLLMKGAGSALLLRSWRNRPFFGA
jgi:hypothetical protein